MPANTVVTTIGNAPNPVVPCLIVEVNQGAIFHQREGLCRGEIRKLISYVHTALRRAFLRHLPKRLETLRKRGYRLCTQGWDVNALSLLFREIQTLAGTCGRYGLLDLSEHLFSLESLLTPFVEEVAIPNATQMESFAAQLRGLEPLIVQHENQYGETTTTQAAAALCTALFGGEDWTGLAVAPSGPRATQRTRRDLASIAHVVATCSSLFALMSAPVMNHVRRSGELTAAWFERSAPAGED